MKKTSTLILLLCLFLSVNAQKKKIGYYTFQKVMDATATTVDNDPVLKMLQADPNLDVTANILTDNTFAATADFSPYDAVVIMESFGGGDQILMPTGALGLPKLTKPTLYNKSFAFKGGRNLPSGSTGAGAETVGSATLKFVYLNVDAAHKSHDLFKDITFTGDSVALFQQGTTDPGATGSGYKAINYATSVYISNPNTLLAKPNTVKAADLPNLTVSFNDLPAGTVIGGNATQTTTGITLQNRVITVGMNFGAICATNGTNITDAGLKIFKNAVYTLAGVGKVSGITVTGAGNATTISSKHGTLQMSASITPVNADNQTVTWSVNDETIATISSSGLLTAVKDGSVTVKATANDGSAVYGTLDITISGQTKKKIGYYTFQKVMDATAATVDNEPVLKMLQADPKLEVVANILTDNTATATADFSPYDAVVIMESFGGGDGILTPNGALGLSKLTKPTLYDKCFAFKAGRNLPTGSTGTGAETAGSASLNFVYLNVDAAHKSHDLFKGITFTGDSVALFQQGTTDPGATGSGYKALNYATSVYISDPNTLLARPNTVKAADLPNLTVSFNDLPAGTVIGGNATQTTTGITLQNRVITVGMNFGAICATNGTNITSAGLKIFKNAVYSLAGIGPVHVTGITISSQDNATSITTQGGTLQMSTAVLPADADDQTVTWGVNDESVATISSTGLLTAKRNGTVTVKASANDGSNVFGSLDITISGQIVPVTGINVQGENGAITITTNHGTLQMFATVLPESASDKSITWSINNDAIATISPSGILTAAKNGKVTVTATSNSKPDVTGSIDITLSGQIVEVNKVKISGTDNATLVKVGNTLQMVADVQPTDATDKTVTWSVNDESVATISSNGLLTALKSGVVTVKATSNSNPQMIGVTQIAVTSRTVGINDIDFEQIIVSPNPASDVLYISNAASLKEIEILNNQGQLVKTVTNGSDKAQIDINDLKPGVYILRSGKYVKRFVKK